MSISLTKLSSFWNGRESNVNFATKSVLESILLNVIWQNLKTSNELQVDQPGGPGRNPIFYGRCICRTESLHNGSTAKSNRECGRHGQLQRRGGRFNSTELPVEVQWQQLIRCDEFELKHEQCPAFASRGLFCADQQSVRIGAEQQRAVDRQRSGADHQSTHERGDGGGSDRHVRFGSIGDLAGVLPMARSPMLPNRT